MKPPIKTAVVGYGPLFSMGKYHAQSMNATGVMEVVAVCDTDPKRLKAAREDLGDVRTYNDAGKLAKDKDVQLAAVVVPHNVHCAVTLPLLRAGKHVVVEKPFAVTIKECDRMIEAAKKAGVVLSVFHNRRQDGDFLAVKDIIDQGYIGDVFHFEAACGGYGHPPKTWRSDKKMSGGVFYDWGAHYVDWMLQMVPGKMKTVSGQFQKRVWKDTTNEDHVEAYVKFDSGAVAHVQVSDIVAARKPKWYILGSEGAIVDTGHDGKFTVHTRVRDRLATFEVSHRDTVWNYYESLADHLVKGAPNPVTPESARRVIAVMALAERSSKTGKEQTVPYE
jgi:predicted dehydrogenase